MPSAGSSCLQDQENLEPCTAIVASDVSKEGWSASLWCERNSCMDMSQNRVATFTRLLCLKFQDPILMCIYIYIYVYMCVYV